MPEQRFRITPTAKGAIFRVKRWFYGMFHHSKLDEDVKRMNKEAWVKLANMLVEETSKRGVSDQPTRITIVYESGPKSEFKPISATVEIFDVKLRDKFTVYFAREKAMENLRSQLKRLRRRAEELGVSLDELLSSEELG